MTGGTLARALARPKFGSGPAVPRLEFIKAQWPGAHWLSDARAIHVTGSQGKGSVVTLTAALFDTLAISCGRFISPHLIDPGERIWLDGAPASETALRAAARRFDAQETAYLTQHRKEAFGAFEAATALAFNVFSEAGVETAVLEAGIGGRHDATRAAGGRIAALTGVDLEHTALLGARESEILEDKANICPPGGLLIAGTLSPALRAHLDRHAARRGVEVQHLADHAAIRANANPMTGAIANITLDGDRLEAVETRLFGAAQLENAALALLIVKRWLQRANRWPGARAFGMAARTMLARTALPLRFSCIGSDPVTIIDVAHTGRALRALVDTIDDVLGARRCVFLVGLSSDKPAAYLLGPLLPRAAAFVFTRARHRGQDPEALAALAPDLTAAVIEDPAAAFARAREEARSRACPLIVTGSAFLAAEVKTIAAGEDPAALWFL